VTVCPFRVVDEINQGMDQANERRVFTMLSEAASAAGTPQCFLLTPKLLPQLTFRAACTVLQILNGPTLGDVPGLDFTTARAPRTRPAPRTRWPLRGFLRASCLVARSPRPGNALGTRAQASACRQGPRRSAGRGAQGHHSFRQLPPAAPRRARCARDRSCCSGSAPCWRAPHRAGRSPALVASAAAYAWRPPPACAGKRGHARGKMQCGKFHWAAVLWRRAVACALLC
jgi:hypothetical protein